jgi:Fe-S oxidoreductase
MLNVETIRKVRQAYFRDGKANREITRDFNLSRNTVRNIIRSGITDQKYERIDQPYPKLGSFIERLSDLLKENSGKPVRHRKSAQILAAKTVDLSTLVKKLVDEGRLTLKEGQQLGTITYHDSCHLKRTLKVSEQPRELLQKAGYELSEMFECDTCCGMGGSYSMKLPEISAPILQRKLHNIKQTGATTVAMDCPGCVMQIRGGFDQDGAAIKVRHTVELLAEQVL